MLRIDIAFIVLCWRDLDFCASRERHVTCKNAQQVEVHEMAVEVPWSMECRVSSLGVSLEITDWTPDESSQRRQSRASFERFLGRVWDNILGDSMLRYFVHKCLLPAIVLALPSGHVLFLDAIPRGSLYAMLALA